MRRRRKDPYTRERRDALEILSMLAGRTNYRVPTEGHSTAAPRLTALDVAHAIASSTNKIGAAVGLAISCQRAWEFPKIHELAYPHLLDRLRGQKAMPGVVDGPKRYRIRIVLRDAFFDLIYPALRVPLKLAAKRVSINEHAYRWLYRQISAYLESEAYTAARDACTFLFADTAKRYAGGKKHVLLLLNSDGEAIISRGDDPKELAIRSMAQPLELLIAEMAATGSRERTLGILTLGGRPHIAVHVKIDES